MGRPLIVVDCFSTSRPFLGATEIIRPAPRQLLFDGLPDKLCAISMAVVPPLDHQPVDSLHHLSLDAHYQPHGQVRAAGILAHRSPFLAAICPAWVGHRDASLMGLEDGDDLLFGMSMSLHHEIFGYQGKRSGNPTLPVDRFLE
ncbi:hypothetical protein [Halomonas aquatica]|uniref:Uncharacterized protein n=1 Tax=Halomonas aquatica TaxID=3151123 RepID=A0ABV1NDQ2_9GAMM